MAKIKLVLEDTAKQMEAKIGKALVNEINTSLNIATGKMVSQIRKIVKEAIMNQPEVKSLEGGKLAAEFGLRDGADKIQDIIEFWVNGITIHKTKAIARGGQIKTKLTINMIQRDYKDILATPSATVTTAKGQVLPWLEWLLKFGDRTILRDFEVSYNRGRLKRSRSGVAVMVKKEGSRWKVPSEFSGTPHNNFLTRALDSIEPEIINIIKTQAETII